MKILAKQGRSARVLASATADALHGLRSLVNIRWRWLARLHQWLLEVSWEAK